jgi:hypothetical protein
MHISDKACGDNIAPEGYAGFSSHMFAIYDGRTRPFKVVFRRQPAVFHGN